MSKYKVEVNKRVVKVEFKKDQVFLNDEPFVTDLLELRQGHYHLLHNNKSYRAEIIKHDQEDKSIVIKVNNTIYNLKVRDRYDELLHSMGMDTIDQKKVNDVKAPMPGLVLKVMVEPGQTISKGDALVVLEAMKMENILKAPSDGIVKKILVTKGDKVEKNQVMVNMN